MTNLYIDCEWFPNQKLFLLGFCFSETFKNKTIILEKGQLFDSTLTLSNVKKLLHQVDGFIFFYGPDIGMLEKFFKIDIRTKYRCVNLMPIFKNLLPQLPSHRLCELEKIYGLNRSSAQYKKNIRTLIRDWYVPERKKNALKYNMEDVINLYKLQKTIFHDVGFSFDMLDDFRMK